jgi:hypothetical protein
VAPFIFAPVKASERIGILRPLYGVVGKALTGDAPTQSWFTDGPFGVSVAVMTTYQPRTLHSDSIVRPPCSKCGTKTRLYGIEPDVTDPKHELLTFVCPNCDHVETAVGLT